VRITFLGTAAARPTVGRNVSSLIIQREGDVMMFDCGEGTQRQMMRFGTGFTFRDIFFTHLHADHFLGVIGLLRTLGLQAREEPVDLWTPRGTEDTLRQAVELGVERVPFEVRIHELAPGEAVERGVYDIVPFKTSHRGGQSLGYAIVEHPRLGRFNADKARELGIPEGPLWGKLHHGEPVEWDGRVFRAEDIVGAERPGRRVVYTGDTRPCASTPAAPTCSSTRPPSRRTRRTARGRRGTARRARRPRSPRPPARCGWPSRTSARATRTIRASWSARPAPSFPRSSPRTTGW